MNIKNDFLDLEDDQRKIRYELENLAVTMQDISVLLSPYSGISNGLREILRVEYCKLLEKRSILRDLINDLNQKFREKLA